MQFVDRIESLENNLAAMGRTFSEEDKIRTIIRGLRIQFATTRDLIRDLGKRHSKAVAMLMAKEAELESSDYKPERKYKTEMSFTSKGVHPKRALFHCGNLRHYKRDSRDLNGRKKIIQGVILSTTGARYLVPGTRDTMRVI